MDAAAAYDKGSTQHLFPLSDLLKRPVIQGGEKIGRLADLVIVDKDRVAEVTHVSIARPFGRPAWFIPWSQVEHLTETELRIAGNANAEFPENAPDRSVL